MLLGNDQDAADRSVLDDHKISHVINVTSHVPLYFQSDGVKYLRFPASDSGVQNLRQYFEEAISFIGQRFEIPTLSKKSDSSPMVSNGCIVKCSGPYWSNPPFLIFDILALWPGWVKPVWR